MAYDPLDGSSVAGAGWAVGAIFGVWPGKGLVGRKGDEQAAAAYAVFGPRSTLVVASPRGDNDGGEGEGEGEERRRSKKMVVDEFLLNSAGKWALARERVLLDDDDDDDASADDDDKNDGKGKEEQKLPRYFAPANLRAARDNAAYKKLVLEFMCPPPPSEGEGSKSSPSPATLRYTGALVADVHHVLTKRNGVFLNPASRSAPPKLRFLYEVAPLALIVEAAGGAAEDGDGRVLLKSATKADARCVVAFGSKGGVAAAREALVEGGGSL